MALKDNDGSVPKERMSEMAEPSNLERAEERANRARQAGGKIKFPMHVHKANGLVKEVTNEDQLADAVGKGWYEDIRDVPDSAPKADPTKISEMTPAQAAKFLEAADDADLMAIEADEQSHGNRPKVLELIEARKDAAGGGKPAPKKAKAKK